MTNPKSQKANKFQIPNLKYTVQSLRSHFILFLIITLLIGIQGINIADDKTTINIGNRRELFVDQFLIDKTEGEAELVLHKPVMRGVVIVHDKPWEGNTCGYHTIFKDDKVYRMYYRAWHHKNKKEIHPAYVCYAESRDGIAWAKPDLNIVPFKRTKKNNIILQGKGSHNFVPFKDYNPKCRPEERYKAFGGEHKEGGLYAFSSADGVNWKLMSGKPVITSKPFAFDSQNVAFWDTERSEYRAYFRAWRKGVRDIQTTISKDFKTWNKPVWVNYPGAPIEHLYTNQILPYYRGPHIFFGFPSRYIEKRGSLVEGLFMSSRDGKIFKRWGEAIIRPGQNKDRWFNRSNYIWWGLVETHSDLPGAGNELSIYSNERYYKGEAGKIRRYTYRIDGFVSVNGSFKGGKVLTKPFTFTGRKLILNFSTSAAGSVKIALTNASGKQIKGFTSELYGDEISKTVIWKNRKNLSSYAGKEVRLIFTLKDADVYSFQFVK